jgi:hypothetical protein
MRRLVIVIASLMLLGGSWIAASSLSATPDAGAATPKIKVSGSLVAGAKRAESGVPVMIQFDVHNSGSVPYGSPGGGLYYQSFYVLSGNGTVTSTECIQTQDDGYDIGGDCELLPLAPHSTAESAVDVFASSDPPDLTVESCVGASPGGKTYCGTITVPLDD